MSYKLILFNIAVLSVSMACAMQQTTRKPYMALSIDSDGFYYADRLSDEADYELYNAKQKYPLTEQFITQFPGDAKKITHVACHNSNLSNLKLFKSFINARQFCLGRNKINDLTGILDFKKITDLSLNHNNLTELPKELNILGLRSLNLSGNKLKDIECISKIDSLEELRLNDNEIEDIYILSMLLRQLQLFKINNNPLQKESLKKTVKALDDYSKCGCLCNGQFLQGRCYTNLVHLKEVQFSGLDGEIQDEQKVLEDFENEHKVLDNELSELYKDMSENRVQSRY